MSKTMAFSNGSEYHDWMQQNCCKCSKSTDTLDIDTLEEDPKCRLEHALSIAFCGDGLVNTRTYDMIRPICKRFEGLTIFQGSLISDLNKIIVRGETPSDKAIYKEGYLYLLGATVVARIRMDERTLHYAGIKTTQDEKNIYKLVSSLFNSAITETVTPLTRIDVLQIFNHLPKRSYLGFQALSVIAAIEVCYTHKADVAQFKHATNKDKLLYLAIDELEIIIVPAKKR